MISLTTNVIDKLLVYPENMKKNIDLTHGLVFSQPVLLALTKKGMKREDAYRIVQKNAMDVWESKKNFREVLEADTEVKSVLSNGELGEAFDPAKSLQYVDYIFERVGLG
jgi:adenylosuccinate lyase